MSRRLISLILALCMVFMLAAPAFAAKSYDLVLVHGLSNLYKWSDSFLSTCLNTWGSGNVYIVNLNGTYNVSTRTINGKTVYNIGSTSGGGTDSVAVQAGYLENAIDILQTNYGLSSHFDIIAHSMGGLVSRYYIAQNPNEVAGLVTLGTPHWGSPLATDTQFIGFLIGAGDALWNLQPVWCSAFNQQYPISSAQLYNNGKIYTIRGDSDGRLSEGGIMGELWLGYNTLLTIHFTDSDGLVPKNSAVITGATHIGDFDYDHYNLVRQSSVAARAAQYLP